MRYMYKCPECGDTFYSGTLNNPDGCDWSTCEYVGPLEYIGEAPDESQVYGNDCTNGRCDV